MNNKELTNIYDLAMLDYRSWLYKWYVLALFRSAAQTWFQYKHSWIYIQSDMCVNKEKDQEVFLGTLDVYHCAHYCPFSLGTLPTKIRVLKVER